MWFDLYVPNILMLQTAMTTVELLLQLSSPACNHNVTAVVWKISCVRHAICALHIALLHVCCLSVSHAHAVVCNAHNHAFDMQNVSKEAEKTAGNIADAAPQIADRVSDRLVKEADQVGREVKPAAEKAAKRLSSEADQLGKEARPMADKASANIEAGARQAGEQARPVADKASDAMRKGASDASGKQRNNHCAIVYNIWLWKCCCYWLRELHSLPCLCAFPVCAQCCGLLRSNPINLGMSAVIRSSACMVSVAMW